MKLALLGGGRLGRGEGETVGYPLSSFRIGLSISLTKRRSYTVVGVVVDVVVESVMFSFRIGDLMSVQNLLKSLATVALEKMASKIFQRFNV